MREQFYRFMPWIFGGLLGWLLFHPPVWLQTLGPMAYGVNAVLCALLLVSVVALVIIANLPATLEMAPLPEEAVPAELRTLAERLQRLGFRSAGPARRVNAAPSVILLGFVHEREPIYATAFRTETVQAKVSYDFVSILHGDRGGLTTNADPAGATLPAGPGGLRQVLPGQSLEALLECHRDGLAWLEERGVPCRAVSADTFAQDFSSAMERQRKLFLAAPLRSTLLTLWRTATKRVPFVGSLGEQRTAERQIAQVLAGPSGAVDRKYSSP